MFSYKEGKLSVCFIQITTPHASYCSQHVRLYTILPTCKNIFRKQAFEYVDDVLYHTSVEEGAFARYKVGVNKVVSSSPESHKKFTNVTAKLYWSIHYF